jgi:hypothetical protein
MGVPARHPDFNPQIRRVLEPSPTTSDQDAYEAAGSIVQRFSIVVGGPIYDFLLRMGLMHMGLPNILRRIALMVAVTWLPLLVLSIKDGLAFGHQVTIPFLSDFAVYGRFILGLPLLILAEIVIDPAIRQAVAEFVDARLVSDQELPEFERILRRAQRLRDSWIPEITLLVLAFFPIFVFQHEWTSGAVSSWHTSPQGLTAAGWWYAIFSAPMMKFITYRWGFRYFIWAYFLWRVSKLRLLLMPTHPDHAAGLNFLGLTQKRFGILFCAMGCSFAGRVANSVFLEGIPLGSFKALMVGFVVLSVILALLPLVLLAPKLSKVRKAGLLEYGRLANSYTEQFDRKWVHSAQKAPEPLLGTGDIQSLADMGNSFAFVDAMSIAPITRRLTVQLAVQAALPLIPLIILGTPTPELIHAVLKMVG